MSNGQLIFKADDQLTARKSYHVFCTSENSSVSNSAFTSSQNFLDAPSVTSNSTRYNFTEGSDIKLSCVADGRPQPTITWTKIGESSDVGYPDTQTLIITNANRTKAGAYKCTANNGIGESASASMRVNMFCKCLFVCFFLLQVTSIQMNTDKS